MSIRTFGTNSNVSKKQIRQACKYFLTQLVGDKMASSLVIRIKFVSRLVDDHDSSIELYGDLEWLETNNKPRQYLLRINSSERKSLQLLSLAHECVHVKQFATGEMMEYIKYPSHFRWRKKKIDCDHVEYEKLPWENEAFRVAKQLYKQYIQLYD